MKLAIRPLLACLALLLAAPSCASVAVTPPGFVEVDNHHHDDRYDYRATSPDGLVLAFREVDNPDGGTLEFWTRAIENQMRAQGGYALLEAKDVKTARGAKGVQMRFGFDQGNTPHLYYLTVFADEDCVYIHEVGGTKDLVERHATQIDWAVRNLRLG